MRDPLTSVVHPTSKSSLDPHNFVNVWNTGTPEYNRSRLKSLVEQIPFDDLVREHVHQNPAVSKDMKRGNVQVNFGLASGQSTQPRTPANIRRYLGTAMPSLLSGSMDELNCRTMKICTQICKEVGVRWENPDFLRKNPDVKEYLHWLNVIYGTSDINIALGTFFYLELGGQVKRHQDQMNPPEPLSDVVVVTKFFWDKVRNT